jgi:hypothetical protein
MQEYELTPEAFGYLALRILFFFLAAMVVNRFAQQSQHQTQLYRELAERLAETNRRLEQAQAEARRSERLAALGQLSAGLAHEIRNPLGVIKGSAEMLTQKLQASDELARELAGYISTEVNRLSALVTEFLDFRSSASCAAASRGPDRPARSRVCKLSPIVLPANNLPCANRWANRARTPLRKWTAACSARRKPVRAGLPQSGAECLRSHGNDPHGGTLRVEVHPLPRMIVKEWNSAWPTPAPAFPKNCAKKFSTRL